MTGKPAGPGDLGLLDRFALWLFPCLEGNGEWSRPCCAEVDHEAEAGQ
jgi:hypothetical protein